MDSERVFIGQILKELIELLSLAYNDINTTFRIGSFSNEDTVFAGTLQKQLNRSISHVQNISESLKDENYDYNNDISVLIGALDGIIKNHNNKSLLLQKSQIKNNFFKIDQLLGQLINRSKQNKNYKKTDSILLDNGLMDNLKNKLIIIENEIKKIDEKFSNNFQKENKKYSIQLMKFVEGIEKRFSKIENEIDEKISGFFSNNLEMIEKAKEAFSDKIVKDETKIKEKIGALNENVNDANKILAELNQLYSIVSDKTISAERYNVARKERIASNWFRGFAIFFTLGLIGFLVLTLYDTIKYPEPNQNTSITASRSTESNQDAKAIQSDLSCIHWEYFISRIILVLFASAFIGYLAKEASKHQQQSHYHLQMALNTAGIDPFIAKLSDNDKNEIKKDMVKVLFTNAELSKSNEKQYPIDAQDMLKFLMKLMADKINDTISSDTKSKKGKEEE